MDCKLANGGKKMITSLYIFDGAAGGRQICQQSQLGCSEEEIKKIVSAMVQVGTDLAEGVVSLDKTMLRKRRDKLLRQCAVYKRPASKQPEPEKEEEYEKEEKDDTAEEQSQQAAGDWDFDEPAIGMMGEIDDFFQRSRARRWTE